MLVDEKITKIVGGGFEVAEVKYMDKTEWIKDRFLKFTDDSFFYDSDKKGSNGLPLRKLKEKAINTKDWGIFIGFKGFGFKFYTIYGGQLAEIKKGFKTHSAGDYTILEIEPGYVFVYDSYFNDDVEILINPLDLFFNKESTSKVVVTTQNNSEELEKFKAKLRKL